MTMSSNDTITTTAGVGPGFERFRDRSEAGRVLASRLRRYEGRDDVTVLGLPRGGVPVAAEVARELHAPLDVCVVRKLGVPGHDELAMGAIASGGGVFLDETLIAELRIRRDQVLQVLGRERAELLRRERAYLGNRPPVEVEGRTVIMVDDGLATGATMHAAVLAIRRRHPARIVVAVPVAARPPVTRLSRAADEVVSCVVPERFRAVGEWYIDFSPTSDAEVLAALASGSSGAKSSAVVISAGNVSLEGDLVLPIGAPGVVAFAHGSGSSRRSPRNIRVAEALNHAGLGTLLIDLLSPAEEPPGSADPRLRFDIPLLTQRVIAAVDWLGSETPSTPVGLFGASTGAAAAIATAAVRTSAVSAIVSRGGRPDLAGDSIARVRAPTLLIVGGDDRQVLELNRRALDSLRSVKQLEVVPGAGHLFEEPGALDRVIALAARWFTQYLPR
jgi:predicted phosphoribosyltransferase/pimeloyl-ACP methyl ester carboxylesterase